MRDAPGVRMTASGCGVEYARVNVQLCHSLRVGIRSRAAVPLLGALGALHASDPTIASTALVTASRAFEMPTGLVVTASSIGAMAQAATVVSTGMIADRLGRRRLLMLAVTTGMVGSLIVAFTPSPWIYVLGRLVTGVGLGAVFGSSYAMVREVTAGDGLARNMGMFAAVSGALSIVLSFIGGSLASVQWRLSFFVVPIVSLVALVLMPRLLPDVPRTAIGPVDLHGQIALGLGLLGVLLGLSQASDGWTNPWTIGPIAMGLVFLAAFVVIERRSRHAFFPVAILIEPVFLGALCAGFVYSFGTAVTVLQMANLWQYYTGIGPQEVARWQLPFLIATIVGSLAMGRLMTKRLTPARTIALGTVIASVGMGYLGLVDEALTPWLFVPGLVAVGFGAATAALPSRTLVLDATPARYFGPVTSSRTAFSQFFYAIGISVVTTVVTATTYSGLIQQLEQGGVPPARIGSALDLVRVYVETGAVPTESSNFELVAQGGRAYVTSFTTVMVLAALTMLVVGLIGALLVTRGSRRVRETTSLERGESPEPSPDSPTP